MNGYYYHYYWVPFFFSWKHPSWLLQHAQKFTPVHYWPVLFNLGCASLSFMEGDFKATVCRYCHYVHFGTPHSFWVQRHCCKYQQSLKQFVKRNAGAAYKCNECFYSLRHDKCMCWKLVCWRKHVCNTVSLPSHWSYMGQKRMTGGKYQNLLNTDLIVFWVFRRWLLTNAAPVPVNLHLISMSVKHNYHVKLPQLYYNISQSSFV